MKKIFNPCLQQIQALMHDQISRARMKNVEVDKVVLVGGFADSEALQRALKAEIIRINDSHGSSVKLILVQTG
jgi:molecular chaperone DnaK (HSP70)